MAKTKNNTKNMGIQFALVFLIGITFGTWLDSYLGKNVQYTSSAAKYLVGFCVFYVTVTLTLFVARYVTGNKNS